MQDPKPINLQDDAHFRELGWYAVARDQDGHVVSVCARGGKCETEFKDWLVEQFDENHTVTRLRPKPQETKE